MESSFIRNQISFQSDGVTCRGYLYLPALPGAVKLSCVVMANGFTGTADWILPSFAEAFASHGIATLIFDYRNLGESDGQPRQVIDPRRQLVDLKNAIAFARSHPRVNNQSIILWGTSLGGSYVFKVAATDHSIAAVIGNMPAIDAVKGANVDAKMKKTGATKFTLVWTTLQLVAAATIDSLKGFFGLPPHYIKVYGKPGRSFFADPSLAKRFELVAQHSPMWRNQVAPRFLFKAPRYKEGTFESIKAPILLTLATDDVEVSASFIKEKAQHARFIEIKEYPYGHFDLYHGDALKIVLDDQVSFIKRHCK